MTTHFITNQTELLSDHLNGIMPKAKSLHFLVGFFYFSGFTELYKNIGDKHTRVLIGLETERRIANVIQEVAVVHPPEQSLSNHEIAMRCYQSMVHMFENTDYFDKKVMQEAFLLFVKKLRDGTLEIRKTVEPNHAKLYIFELADEHNEGGGYPGAIITGSSNLSRAGLRGRHEINVVSRDKSNFIEAKKLFDELWRTAVPVADGQTFPTFEQEVLNKIWIEKLPSPYLMFLRVLEEYFSFERKRMVRLPQEITKNRYFNLKYQTDAIEQALDILEKHDGVIVADVVGLGKSIIASVIAHNVGLRTIVIAPPHLKEQWEVYKREFDYNADVYGSGSIEKALNAITDGHERLIIVDEAHKYRNEGTKDYANLHKLCQSNKVVLLSATPFNNRPGDIFSLIKLFQIPARSSIQTVENLSFRFYTLMKQEEVIRKDQKSKKDSPAQTMQKLGRLAEEIRDILDPVLIRRSRLDLTEIEEYRKDLETQGIEFPTVNPPCSLEYPLPDDLADSYIATLEKISDENDGFIGARYKPATYIINEKKRQELEEEFGGENLLRRGQENLAKFMRRLLVRRYESSQEAFQKTLNAMIESSERIRAWYTELGKVPVFKKGTVPDPDVFLDQNLEGEDQMELLTLQDDEEFSALKQKGFKLLDAKDLDPRFIEQVEHDIELLTAIREEWFGEEVRQDVKLDHFADELEKQISKEPERKIVVFTEFADTADYLFENIKDRLPVFRYHSGHASAQNKETIKANFDASYTQAKKRDEYKVLIATDAISEGYNLNRAGTVINYDIPYNPMRVVQRVGRINRVNLKVFPELFIYNYFPSAIGENETRTKEISTFKIKMHNAIMGDDTQFLSEDEEVEAYYAKKYKEALDQNEERSWKTDFENLLSTVKHRSPENLAQALEIPKRARIRRDGKHPRKGVMVFGRKGEEYTFKIGISDSEHELLTAKEALELFKADQQEKAHQVSDAFESVYLHVKDHLFRGTKETPNTTKLRDTIAKLEWLLENVADERPYLSDLTRAVKELDALSEHHLKRIRKIRREHVREDLAELKEEVTPAFLHAIIRKAHRIEEGEETLILAEELT